MMYNVMMHNVMLHRIAPERFIAAHPIGSKSGSAERHEGLGPVAFVLLCTLSCWLAKAAPPRPRKIAKVTMLERLHRGLVDLSASPHDVAWTREVRGLPARAIKMPFGKRIGFYCPLPRTSGAYLLCCRPVVEAPCPVIADAMRRGRDKI